MRPVRLTLRGFGPFRDEQTLDFSDIDAFALVGPTGSGKSTVLDAMCFALYGKVPRHGKGAATGDVLAVGTNELVVALTFAVHETEYLVVRVVRRKGKAGKPTTAEARLERVVRPAVGDDAGETLPMANGAQEVDTAVLAVVGLSFEHFTRCVLLPQGEFARFLLDEPRDRRALLLRLLDLGFYDEMRARAESIAKEQRTRADVLDEQRQRAGVDAVDDAALATRLIALAKLDVVLGKTEPELAKVEADAAIAESAMREVEGLIKSLEAVQVPTELADLEREQLADSERLKALTAAAEAASVRWESALAERDGLPTRKATEELLATHARVAKGRAVVATLADATRSAAQVRENADSALRESQQAFAGSRSDHEAATRQHAAHALAVMLVVGEPCPVCERAVDSLPLANPNATLTEIEDRLRGAERDLDSAQRHAATAAKAEAEASAKYHSQAERLDELALAIADHGDLAALEASLAAISGADDRVEAIRVERDRCRSELQEFRSHQSDHAARRTRYTEAFHRQRDALLALAPPAPSGSLTADWLSLVEWAVPARTTQEVRADEARETVARSQQARTMMLDAVASALVDADLSAAGSIGSIRAAVAGARSTVEATRERVAADRERLVQLEADIAGARRRSDVAASLGQHLRSNNFQDWLVSEAIESLAAVASETLMELSDNAYSLVYRDDTFAVVDHVNGDEVRSARSLSGGETFQASLALAFALADEIARQRSSARLDAVFLDEGFGTLDPESLDKVANTIASLSDGRRLVGLVTHVAELAQRQPVRFRVSRVGRSSTITREVD
jgi:DNA repair protein SbcC/Rad50